LVLLC
jgi:hypothetical protein